MARVENRLMPIVKLPESVRQELASIIDMHGSWDELGDKMKVPASRILYLKSTRDPRISPTKDIFEHCKTTTVAALYLHLYALSIRRAMEVLSPYVVDDIKIKCGVGVELHVAVNNITLESTTDNSQQDNTDSRSIENMNMMQPEMKKRSKIQNVGDMKEVHLRPKVEFSQKSVASQSTSLPPVSATLPDPPGALAKSASSVVLNEISYKNLEAATRNWSQENMLRAGGFGNVFRGTLKGVECAIKRFEPQTGDKLLQLRSEFRTLKSIDHANILELYGFCEGSGTPCLLYPYMINGSLEDSLSARNGVTPLTLPQKLCIAKGTANALYHLKEIFKKPVVIKSSNILLDSNLVPRVGGFCLPCMVPESPSEAMQAYLPDNFSLSMVSQVHLDSFSLGVVLLELATDQPAYDIARSPKYLRHEMQCREEVVKRVKRDHDASYASSAEFQLLVALGVWCVSDKDRQCDDPLLFLLKEGFNVCKTGQGNTNATPASQSKASKKVKKKTPKKHAESLLN